ncbi:hypothetical protein BLS_001514 [Venturia inaequalis]|uniref:DUF8021 domain-containing protein n=1 Tax=Venturia inaequalis TaxID=5025 RepID=A0A8H3YII4_VENIN|nr:hypothetical protein BLS_001514 [Venturia inaequalis]
MSLPLRINGHQALSAGPHRIHFVLLPPTTMTVLKVLALLLSASPLLASAECTRESLIAARDAFFKGAPAKPEKLAANVKVALNNKPTPLDSTPYSKIHTSTWTALQAQAVDTEMCEIATFKVSSQQILSTRLKLDAAGKISETEFQQAVQGDQSFRPTGFPKTTPPMFNEKQRPAAPPTIPADFTPAMGMFDKTASINKATCKALSGAPRLWTRKELLYAASSYCDGLKGAPYDSCVFAGSSCPRTENGVTTTQNCAKGIGKFGFTVRGRRWTVDTETGVILGVFYFDYGPGSNLFLHEYFKVQAGSLAYILALLKNIPHAQASLKTFS